MFFKVVLFVYFYTMVVVHKGLINPDEYVFVKIITITSFVLRDNQSCSL